MQKNMNDHTFLQIFKGKCFTKNYVKKYQKVLAFDLDETLGSFAHLNVLWSGIIKLKNIPDPQNLFNKILDLYPEFIRYGILNILDYLYMKKKEGELDKLYIYTNNRCRPPWVSFIARYFEYKMNINEDLFDKIISAFKINNKVIEVNRTSRKKTYSDFISCTVLPKTTEICFIDNTYYNEMLNEKVYYIQPRAYIHDLTIKQIIERFIHSDISKEFIDEMENANRLRSYLNDWFLSNDSIDVVELEKTTIDFLVAQKMMYHIKEYFYLTNRKDKTRKMRIKLTRTTRKKTSEQMFSE
jgi:hypothetical protein